MKGKPKVTEASSPRHCPFSRGTSQIQTRGRGRGEKMSAFVMTFNRNLSFDIVASFYRGYIPLIGPGLRHVMRMVENAYIHHEASGVTEETGLGTNHGVFWLLDRMEDIPSPVEHKPHLNQTDWRP